MTEKESMTEVETSSEENPPTLALIIPDILFVKDFYSLGFMERKLLSSRETSYFGQTYSLRSRIDKSNVPLEKLSKVVIGSSPVSRGTNYDPKLKIDATGYVVDGKMTQSWIYIIQSWYPERYSKGKIVCERNEDLLISFKSAGYWHFYRGEDKKEHEERIEYWISLFTDENKEEAISAWNMERRKKNKK